MSTSRTRSEHAVHTSGINIVESWDYSDVYSTTSTTKFLPHAYERVTNDVVTPGYAKLSASGVIVNNPFSTVAYYRSFSGSWGIEQWTNLPSGTWRMNGRHYWDHGFWTFISPSVVTPGYTAPIDSMKAAAINSSLANINRTTLNAPLFLLELSKARKMFIQLGQGLLQTYRQGMLAKHLVRARMRGKRIDPNSIGFKLPTSKNLSNAWLMGRFGLTPMFYELQGACQLLNQKLENHQRFTARGSQSDQYDTTASWTFFDGIGNIWGGKTTSVFETQVKAGTLYEIENLIMASAARSGATRPLTVAWELIPWSFVIDRFVDIGTWLDAIQPNGASTILSGWNTVTIKEFHRYEPDPSKNVFGPAYGSTVRNGHFALSCNIAKVTKIRTPGYPTASLPSWSPSFNRLHLADYASLIRQRIKSGKF